MLKILKNKRGSPLVEEGLLLGLAAITFTVILSVVSGFLQSINAPVGDLTNSLGNGLGSLAQQLGEILNQIARAIGIR